LVTDCATHWILARGLNTNLGQVDPGFNRGFVIQSYELKPAFGRMTGAPKGTAGVFVLIRTISHASFLRGIIDLLAWCRWPKAWVHVFCYACLLVAATSAARASAVLTWNNEMLQYFRETSALLVNGPPEIGREMAVVGTAMYDAVNAATGQRYHSYAYTGGAVAGASADAAALAAGYTALNSIFSNPVWTTPLGQYTGNGGITASILSNISATYSAALTALGTAADVSKGLALGQSAANAVIANRANDGSLQAIQNGTSTQAPPGSGTVPGVYVPPATRPEMLPIWGKTVAPFAVSTSTLQAIEASLPGPPALGSAAYAHALLETECAGSAFTLSASVASACTAAGIAPETPAQTQAALFWNDPGTTFQPPGHWLDIADTVMVSQNLNLLEQARLSALLGMAENDAGIGAWSIKYQDKLWRPITAIRNCGPGGNGSVTWSTYFTTCDTTWQSQIATPPHADYIAGHPAFSGAAATVLKDFFGTDDIGFCSTSDPYLNGSLGFVGPITICFDSFSDASSGPSGAEYSRVAGGIHTPFSVQDALTLGNAIGDIVGRNSLLPVPEPGTLSLLGAAVLGLGLLRGRRTGMADAIPVEVLS
jgi:hypothetical protein